MKNIYLVLICLNLVGCAASEKMKDYPRRMLDRPYNLLEGMTEAHQNITQGYTKSPSFYDLSDPIPLYTYWIHAVSDDFSFIWLVLPLGFQYQWVKTPQHNAGFRFFMHIGHPDDSNISPLLTYTDRRRLNHDWDLQTETGMQSYILFKQHRVDWDFSLVSGPRWQFHDFHLVYFWAGFLHETTPFRDAWSLSGGITYTWSVTKQFEIDLRLVKKMIGERITTNSDRVASLGLRYLF